MKKSTVTVFLVLAGCMLFLSGIWIYFQKTLDKVDVGEGEGAASYSKHYLMISNEKNNLMWKSIYESASQAAKEADAYVELISPEHGENYTQADYLRIGIASQVDGIILEADGTSEEEELIQEAQDAGIPVVTVLTDDSSSVRLSFVGLNSYQLGNTYTEQISGLPEGMSDYPHYVSVKFPVQNPGNHFDLLSDQERTGREKEARAVY